VQSVGPVPQIWFRSLASDAHAVEVFHTDEVLTKDRRCQPAFYESPIAALTLNRHNAGSRTLVLQMHRILLGKITCLEFVFQMVRFSTLRSKPSFGDLQKITKAGLIPFGDNGSERKCRCRVSRGSDDGKSRYFMPHVRRDLALQGPYTQAGCDR
jgi:hypothetical protein